MCRHGCGLTFSTCPTASTPGPNTDTPHLLTHTAPQHPHPQHDVSARVWAEKHLARVMEAEHALLESIFPTHGEKHGAGHQQEHLFLLWGVI